MESGGGVRIRNDVETEFVGFGGGGGGGGGGGDGGRGGRGGCGRRERGRGREFGRLGGFEGRERAWEGVGGRR